MNYLYDFSKIRLYIDPATTSYVIQIVAGIIIACSAGFGIFWSKFKRKFRKNSDEKMSVPKINEKDNMINGKDIIKAEDLLEEEEK